LLSSHDFLDVTKVVLKLQVELDAPRGDERTLTSPGMMFACGSI
jgi:hypothetical protein